MNDRMKNLMVWLLIIMVFFALLSNFGPSKYNRDNFTYSQFMTAVKDGALDPGYAGIRPKISAPGEEAADFVVQGPADHGVPGLVNLFGIESPGLTASLAIAERVREVL